MFIESYISKYLRVLDILDQNMCSLVLILFSVYTFVLISLLNYTNLHDY